MDPLLNDLDFKFDPNEIDDDDDEEVALAMKTTLGNGGGIFNTDNLNPYSYGYNDPVRFDDPDGRCPICIYVVAALLYSEFANAPTGDTKTDSRNYEASKGNKALVSGAVLAGGTRTILNSAKSKVVEKVTETTKGEKTHQTYTKTNKETKETYSGRTSGKGTPKENVAKRDGNHHKNKDGFGPAKLDKSSTNKNAIRGREQELIKNNGGAKSEGGTSGNAINGVSPKNPNAKVYENASKKEFGQ
jgi:hypothetical protein